MSERMTRVEMVWEDAHSHAGNDPLPAMTERATKPMVVHTVGYLLVANERVVAVVQGHDSDDDVWDMVAVPRGMVRSLITLRKGETVI